MRGAAAAERVIFRLSRSRSHDLLQPALNLFHGRNSAPIHASARLGIRRHRRRHVKQIAIPVQDRRRRVSRACVGLLQVPEIDHFIIERQSQASQRVVEVQQHVGRVHTTIASDEHEVPAYRSTLAARRGRLRRPSGARTRDESAESNRERSSIHRGHPSARRGRRASRKELSEVILQRVSPRHDGAPPVNQASRRRVRPRRVGPIQQIRIPQDRTIASLGPGRQFTMDRRGVWRVPEPDGLRLVPAMDHASIGQQIRRPLRSRIAGKHVEPHGVRAHIRLRVFREQFVLHPTGACNTDRSRRREQQHEPNLAEVVVEQRPKFLDAFQI